MMHCTRQERRDTLQAMTMCTTTMTMRALMQKLFDGILITQFFTISIETRKKEEQLKYVQVVTVAVYDIHKTIVISNKIYLGRNQINY